MAALLIVIVVTALFLLLNGQSEKKMLSEVKRDLEQKRLQQQREEYERKRKIDEAQKQRALIEKHELEQKRLRENQKEVERKIEANQRQIIFTQNTIREQELKFKQQFQNKFTIFSNDYLKKDITAFYHSDYHSGGNWKLDGTIENMIWTLKNDSSPFPHRLTRAKQRLEDILSKDLPQILSSTQHRSLTVCVVPRAKKDSYYRNDQLYFRQSIIAVVNKINGLYNGTDYIKRHTNTKTTHLRGEAGGEGRLPFVGIMKRTCAMSSEIQNKDILLIDDIYTYSVNIDEDAIQALLDNGAKSVIFYAVGKTISRY